MRKSVLLFVSILFLTTFGKAFAQENKLDDQGNKHGLWKGYFEESKRVKYEGTFNHGKETGIFTFYDDTKIHTVTATRDFTKGKNSAYTTFYDPKKNVVSEGNVVNKIYDGPWKYYHEASKTVMTLENYKDGKLDGKRSIYYPDGTLAEQANYTAGIQNGPYKKYTEKGTVLEEVTYKNGQPDGLAVYRDPDGTVASKGNYVNGLKKGYWEFFQGGKLTKKEKYPLVKKFQKGKKKQI